MQALRDAGYLASESIGDAKAWGVETSLTWSPGDLWNEVEGSELEVGYAWTDSIIDNASSAQYQNNKLPWYPTNEVWASATYALPFSCAPIKGTSASSDCKLLALGSDFQWVGQQFTSYINAEVESADGSTGALPSYWTVGVFLRSKLMLPNYWPLEIGLGVRNLSNELYYFRSDDFNGGRIVGRPRTYWISVSISHIFMKAWEKAQEREQSARERSRP